jgi:hypothetical protein
MLAAGASSIIHHFALIISLYLVAGPVVPAGAVFHCAEWNNRLSICSAVSVVFDEMLEMRLRNRA